MQVVLTDIPEKPIVKPPGLITARIDPETGKLASTNNPDAVFEVFRARNVPTEVEEEQTGTPDPFSERVTVPDSPIQLF